jgi:hypothetical protein
MALEIAAKERLWVLAAKDGSLFCIECPCDKILDPETPKGLARDRIVTRHFHTHSFEGGEAVAHFQDTHDEGSELDEQTVVQNYGRKGIVINVMPAAARTDTYILLIVRMPKDGDVLPLVAAHNLSVFNWYRRVMHDVEKPHKESAPVAAISKSLTFSVRGLKASCLRNSLGQVTPETAESPDASPNHPSETICPRSRPRRFVEGPRTRSQRALKPKQKGLSCHKESADILRGYFNYEIREVYERVIGPWEGQMDREEMIRLIVEARELRKGRSE